jgi:hypothetical protein
MGEYIVKKVVFLVGLLLGGSLLFADATSSVDQTAIKKEKKKVEKPWDYFALNVPALGLEKSFYISQEITGIIGTGFLGLSPYVAIGKVLSPKTRINLGLSLPVIDLGKMRARISPFASFDYSLGKRWILSTGFQICSYSSSTTTNTFDGNGYHVSTRKVKKGNAIFPFIGFRYRF